MEGFEQVVARSSVVVCCGSGGVGKTTVAAAVALGAARRGRTACVVTVDPARRLADALGLEGLSNAPRRIEGDWPGQLWALMLDPKGTFDDLVHEGARGTSQAEAILGNRIYRNLSSALSGTQEYMAIEKLHQLHADSRFDLVVVDTPPTREALNLIEAPERLTRFLDNRAFRAIVAPGKAYLRMVGSATRALLRAVARVVGSEVVDDAIAFFQAFEGMEEGFRRRAGQMLRLMSDDSTAFVLVASPRRESLDTAGFFADKLAGSGIKVRALVVNKLHPRFDVPSALGAPATAGPAPTETATPASLGILEANLADLLSVSAREEETFAQLAARLSPAPVARVPFLATDVHDLDGLETVASFVYGQA